MARIYLITCKGNGMVYIGQTIQFPSKRKKDHWREFEKGEHTNPRMQNAADFYGIESFTFEVIEECLDLHKYERETHWIKEYGKTHKLFNVELDTTDPDTHHRGKLKRWMTSEAYKQQLMMNRKERQLKKSIKSSGKEIRKVVTVIKRELNKPTDEERRAYNRKEYLRKVGRDRLLTPSEKRERKGTAKLTDKQASEIRNKYIPNEYGYKKLAKEYGVSRHTIMDIVKEKTYL